MINTTRGCLKILQLNYYQNMIGLIALFVSLSQCLMDQSFEQFLSSTPKTFGLLTVTHARGGNYTYFQQFIDKYASMDCPSMTEISIVWNNDISPQQAGIVERAEWKRPIYYYQTPHNSMDFRYNLPAESKAEIYFSLDDDVVVDCEELVLSFNLWKQTAIGNIGPLVGYGFRGCDYNSTTQQFNYGNPRKGELYSHTLVGLSWISRIFLNLYNTKNSEQIAKMRQIVRTKNNCDDIALNFIVAHYFPQLIPTPVHGKIQMVGMPFSQFGTKDHMYYRSECFKQFTQILGYNPLKLSNSKVFHKQTPLGNEFTLYITKKQILEKYILPSESTDSLSEQQFNGMLKSQTFQKLVKNAKPVTSQNKKWSHYYETALSLLTFLLIALSILIVVFLKKIKQIEQKTADQGKLSSIQLKGLENDNSLY